MSKHELADKTGVWLLYAGAPLSCRLAPSSDPSRPPMAKGSLCACMRMHTRAVSACDPDMRAAAQEHSRFCTCFGLQKASMGRQGNFPCDTLQPTCAWPLPAPPPWPMSRSVRSISCVQQEGALSQSSPRTPAMGV